MTTAAINVITGINGAGKTLFGLQQIEKLRKETNRPVYYWGIPGIQAQGILKDWKLIEEFEASWPDSKITDPASLHDIEAGAIIVCDEAHKAYGRTGDRGEPPPHIERFSMSRHKGHTWFMFTQNAADLHLFIRRRIGQHWHLRRVFGMESSTVTHWQEYGDPDSTKSVEKAEKFTFAFPKEVYGWYKSSDSHTIQKKLPLKTLAKIPVAVALVALGVWYALSKLAPEGAEKTQEATEQSPATQTAPHTPNPRQNRQQEAQQWAVSMTERVKGMPMSASFYDGAWKPRAVPRISGCSHIVINGDERCSCNTQQGTTITTMTFEACLHYVKNGWFDPMEPDQGERNRTVAAVTPEQPSPAGLALKP